MTQARQRDYEVYNRLSELQRLSTRIEAHIAASKQLLQSVESREFFSQPKGYAESLTSNVIAMLGTVRDDLQQTLSKVQGDQLPLVTNGAGELGQVETSITVSWS
jgi:hypothetical protein